jgi:hypothetical protein
MESYKGFASVMVSNSESSTPREISNSIHPSRWTSEAENGGSGSGYF